MKRALEGLHAIERVDFDPDSGLFEVAVKRGDQISRADVQRVIADVGVERGHVYAVRWDAPPRSEVATAVVAPGFVLPTLTGTFTSETVLGHAPTVVTFWASWCAPCIAEAPHLADLYRRYRPRGLRMVAISIDDPDEYAALRRVVDGLDLPYPVALDPDAKVLASYARRGTIPSTFVIDRLGNVAYVRRNFVDGDQRALETAIVQAIEAAGG